MWVSVREKKMTKRSASTQKDGRVAANGVSQNGSLSDPSGKLQDEDDRKVGLGKKVTLLRGVSIIIGTIIGAGIFISPKGILKHSGSVGMSLIVWIACGVLSLFGELVHRYICRWKRCLSYFVSSSTEWETCWWRWKLQNTFSVCTQIK